MTIRAGLAFIEKLWNGTSSMEVEKEDPHSSTQWKVNLGESALEAGLQESLKEADFDYNIDPNFRPPAPSHSLEVAPNRGIILNSDTVKPLVTDINREIIVLFRAKGSDGSDTQLGLAYLANRIDELKNVLNNMLNKSDTKIEIYIAGGNSSSNKLYQSVRQYIESVQAAHRGRVLLQDDYYQAADLRAWLPNAECPDLNLTVKEAGFDLNNQPYLILDYPS
ncbi:hypothetical protein [Simkania sp.]|uniref:hypothetical protein n=1 Tax=Simkania sp. TaxID=34094 RepID=UPI003B52419C